jgi:aspartate/methionine/tyrosine aminotransferase
LILSLVCPGEEVVLFEPCFPQYQDHIQLAGGIYKPIPLELKDGKWSFDPELLEKTLNSKTKLFIFNNAHNPTGKLFNLDELLTITKILD